MGVAYLTRGGRSCSWALYRWQQRHTRCTTWKNNLDPIHGCHLCLAFILLVKARCVPTLLTWTGEWCRQLAASLEWRSIPSHQWSQTLASGRSKTHTHTRNHTHTLRSQPFSGIILHLQILCWSAFRLSHQTSKRLQVLLEISTATAWKSPWPDSQTKTAQTEHTQDTICSEESPNQNTPIDNKNPASVYVCWNWTLLRI